MRKVILILLALAAIRLLPRALRREAAVLELIAVLTRFMTAMASANTAKTQNIEQRVNALVTEGIPQAIAQALESGTISPVFANVSCADIAVSNSATCFNVTVTGGGNSLTAASGTITCDGLSVSDHVVFNTSGNSTTSEGFLWANGGIRVSPGLPDWPITGGPYNANTGAALNQLYAAIFG